VSEDVVSESDVVDDIVDERSVLVVVVAIVVGNVLSFDVDDIIVDVVDGLTIVDVVKDVDVVDGLTAVDVVKDVEVVDGLTIVDVFKRVVVVIGFEVVVVVVVVAIVVDVVGIV
jgi:hypothetical protein